MQEKDGPSEYRPSTLCEECRSSVLLLQKTFLRSRTGTSTHPLTVMDVARACVERTGPPPGGFLLAFFRQGHVVGHVGELVFQPLLERVVS